MPDKALDISPTSTDAPVITRRAVLGLGVATAILAGSRPLGAKPGSATSAQIANRGSLVDFSAGADGITVLSSFRNAATHFEWVTPGGTFAPFFKCADGTSATWRGLPFRSTPEGITIRAASTSKVEAQLDVVAYADTGAFRWQRRFLNAGTRPTRAITEIGALDLDLRPDLGRLVVHCVRRDGDYSREAQPFRSHLEIQGGRWNAPVFTGLIVVEAVGR